jgi:hypothetical protein
MEPRLWLRVGLVVIAACLIGPAVEAATDCTHLQYRVGRDFIAPGGSRGLAQFSLRPGDVTVANLVCLVQRLRAGNPAWTQVMLVFFTSREAADNWIGSRGLMDYEGAPMPPFEKWDRELRAIYTLDAAQKEDHLDIMPLGWREQPPIGDGIYETRIDFPLTTLPHCGLTLAERCLLAFEKMDDPSLEPNVRLSGTVSMAGTIKRNGTLTGLHIVEAQSDPPDRKDQLVRAVLKNVKAWWLEPGHARIEFALRIHLEPLRGIPIFTPFKN